MANITITADEYADILLISLLDALREDTPLEQNPRFKEFVELLKKRSFKPFLFTAYLETDTTNRVKYKMMKKSLASSSTTRITITGAADTEEEVLSIKQKLKKLVGLSEQMDAQFDRDLCKQIFRKVKDVRYKSGKPITEERLDKIIDFCINEKAEALEIAMEEQTNG